MTEKLARRIAQLAAERGWSHAQLSTRAGLGRGAVNEIINDPTRRPREATLRRLARALDVSVAYLVGETDTREDGRAILEIDGDSIPENLAEPARSAVAQAVTGATFRAFSVCPEANHVLAGAVVICDATRSAQTGERVIAEVAPDRFALCYFVPPYLVALDHWPILGHHIAADLAGILPVATIVIAG